MVYVDRIVETKHAIMDLNGHVIRVDEILANGYGMRLSSGRRTS